MKKFSLLSIISSVALVCGLFSLVSLAPLPVRAAEVSGDNDTSGLWTSFLMPNFAEGDGSSLNPFIIDTPERLARLAAKVNAGDYGTIEYAFEIRGSIDLKGHYWEPIGSGDYPFYGKLTGAAGSEILNLTIDTSNAVYNGKNIKYVGLIGHLKLLPTSGVMGSVSNITIKSANIKTANATGDTYVGCIAGFNDGGKIQSCIVGTTESNNSCGIDTENTTLSKDYIGGIVGYNAGSLGGNTLPMACYANVGITSRGESAAEAHIGGIVGYNAETGTVQKCAHYNGTVIGLYGNIGGVIGTNRAETGVSGNFNGGDVNCTMTESVSYDCNVGGVFGVNYGYITGGGEPSTAQFPISPGISNKGEILTSFGNAGGIAGINYGTLNSFINEGQIKTMRKAENVGGIAGLNAAGASITGSSSAVGYSTVNRGTVLTNTPTNTVTNAGGIAGTNLGRVEFAANAGNIFYTEDTASSSMGTVESAGGVVGKNDVSGQVTQTINTGGVFAEKNAGGIVGTNSGTLQQSYNYGGKVSSSTQAGGYAGGIAGQNNNLLQNCFNTGPVTNGDVSGGIVGYNVGAGAIVNQCYNTANINGTAAGGIAGFNNYKVTNTYNIGEVTLNDESNMFLGGIVGQYVAGSQDSTVINSYYNKEIAPDLLAVPDIEESSQLCGLMSWEMVTQSGDAFPAKMIMNNTSNWITNAPRSEGSVRYYSHPGIKTLESNYQSNVTALNPPYKIAFSTAIIWRITFSGQTPQNVAINLPDQHILNGKFATEPTLTFQGYTVRWYYTIGTTEYNWNFATQTVGADRNLIIGWDPKVYDIVYHVRTGNGAWQIDPSAGAPTHTFGADTNLPNAPRKGYSFEGWYINDEPMTGSPYTVIPADMIFLDGQPIDVYGVWTAKTYTLTLNPNGGTCDASTFNVTFGNSFNLPVPTFTDWYFKGWYSAAEDPATRYTDSVGKSFGPWDIDANITVYAQWVKEIQTVYFVDANNPDGTVTLFEKTATWETSIKRPSDSEIGALDNPEGFQFDNWYADMELTIVFDFENTLITDTTYIYAKWKPIEYRLSFNPNGGTAGTITSVTVPFGEKIANYLITAAGEIPSRIGYTFKGWTDTPMGSEPIGDIVMGAQAQMVYAMWRINSYTITLSPNQGVAGAKTSISNVEYNKSIITLISELDTRDLPTRDGYVFNYWSLGPEEGAEALPTGYSMPANDLTIYAHWLIQYTVTFKYIIFGPPPKAEPVTVGHTCPKPTEDEDDLASHEGWELVGWYKQIGESDKDVESEEFDFNTPITEDITLIAKWKRIDDVGGTGEGNDMTAFYIALGILGGLTVVLVIIIFARRRTKTLKIDSKMIDKYKKGPKTDSSTKKSRHRIDDPTNPFADDD